MKQGLSIEVVAAVLAREVPEARVEVLPNPAVAAQGSLRVDRAHAFAVAMVLRDEPTLRLDYASNVTGVDWLDSVVRDKVKVRRLEAGVERDFEDVVEVKRPGYLEAVYHLYSVALRHGPLVLRVRTENRSDRVRVPSLTPVWRSCELQEREVFDLFGIMFEGHPDLRRILMWDGFEDHPMRKDYVDPDDYEYEPTAHGSVRERARRLGREGGGK